MTVAAKNKVHWNDQHGPICGAYGGINYMGYDWRKVRADSLGEVTCKNCVKRLRQIGFAIQDFSEVVRNVNRKTKVADNG